MLNNFNYKLGPFGSERRQCILKMNTNRRLRRRRTERERGGEEEWQRGEEGEEERNERERREEEGRGKREAVNYIYPRELIRSLNQFRKRPKGRREY